MVRASGPDTAEICAPMPRSGSDALKAAMELAVDQRVLLAQTVGYPKANPVA